MVGFIIAFMGGWRVQKLIPNGLIFVAVLTAASNFLNVILPALDNSALDPIPNLFFTYAFTFVIYATVFLLGQKFSQWFSKRKAVDRSLEDEHAQD